MSMKEYFDSEKWNDEQENKQMKNENFRDAARRLRCPNVDNLSDLEVWQFLIDYHEEAY